jgi:hypothetical protein
MKKSKYDIELEKAFKALEDLIISRTCLIETGDFSVEEEKKFKKEIRMQKNLIESIIIEEAM